jgi:hypothetical protein
VKEDKAETLANADNGEQEEEQELEPKAKQQQKVNEIAPKSFEP